MGMETTVRPAASRIRRTGGYATELWSTPTFLFDVFSFPAFAGAVKTISEVQ